MVVGIPREVKPQEHRIAATPDAVLALVLSGHDVLVEAGAGAGSSFDDDAFREAGATIVGSGAAGSPGQRQRPTSRQEPSAVRRNPTSIAKGGEG